MTKKKGNKINPFILILICACLLFAMYVSLSTLILALWGDTTMAVVDSYNNRLDNTTGEVNRSRTINKGYYFSVGGKEYKGYVIYQSDEAWPDLQEGETRMEEIRYLSTLPYINRPSMLTDFDQMGVWGILYHLIAIPGCIFLFRLVTGKVGKKKKAARKAATTQTNNIRRDNHMFCHNCGVKLSESAVFCSNCGVAVEKPDPHVCTSCGTKLSKEAAFCTHCGTSVNNEKSTSEPTSSPAAEKSNNTQPSKLIGFSDRYKDPEILAAAKTNRKASIGWMWILVLAPLIGFPIAGFLMDDLPLGEGMVIGVGIAFVMLIINLLGLRKAKKPMWEGVVVNKYKKEKYDRSGSEVADYSKYYTEYTVEIQTTEGKIKKVVNVDRGTAFGLILYDQVSIGDRIRYHPTFNLYEKYDKSKDPHIECAICHMVNPIANDRCKRCNNLLFK